MERFLAAAADMDLEDATVQRFPAQLAARVKNTFLEFRTEDDDPWVIAADARRQHTDGVVTARRTPSKPRSNFAGLVPDSELEPPSLLRRMRMAAPAYVAEPRMMCVGQAVAMHPMPHLGGGSLARAEGLDWLAPQGELAPVVGGLPAGMQLWMRRPSPQQAWADHGMAANNMTQDYGQLSHDIAEADFAGAGAEATQMFSELSDSCTTVMLKNVPSKYTQRKLMKEISSAGFLGKFDFIYLPIDFKSRCSRGFAFCNFDHPESARLFHKKFHGQFLQHLNIDQPPLEVTQAEIQGFEPNAEHYVYSRILRKRHNTKSRPMFLRQLPAHLLQEIKEAGVCTVDVEISVGMEEATQEALLCAQMSQHGDTGRLVQQRKTAPQGRSATGQPKLSGPTHNAPVPQRFCHNCGNLSNPMDRFCRYCGTCLGSSAVDSRGSDDPSLQGAWPI